jgi:predicted membrane protein
MNNRRGYYGIHLFDGERPRYSSGLIIGVLVIIAGVILLLDQFGIVNADHLWPYWPIAVILVGLSKFFQCQTRGGRVWGAIITFLGVGLLLENLNIAYMRWEAVWPTVIIAIGGFMAWNALNSPRRGGEPGANTVNSAWLNQFNIFGGGEYRINSRNFRGGDIFVIFGGFAVDLTQADIEGDMAVMNVNAIFGGGEIRIPETWQVNMEGVGIFGGYGDKTSHPLPVPGTSSKMLVIRGAAIFGGVEIKNAR